jgi:hypothetical protein
LNDASFGRIVTPQNPSRIGAFSTDETHKQSRRYSK